MRYCQAAVFCIALTLSLLPAQVFASTQPKPPAPIPAQILTAKKIFVANAGGDAWWSDSDFNGNADRAYNQFYAALKTWGHFELVSNPADADLLVEIQFTELAAIPLRETIGSPTVDPQFRLTIRDPKTNALLWGLIEHVEWAILQGNRDKNFDIALGRTVAEVQRISVPIGTNNATNNATNN